jgi:hypothetical protein
LLIFVGLVAYGAWVYGDSLATQVADLFPTDTPTLVPSSTPTRTATPTRTPTKTATPRPTRTPAPTPASTDFTALEQFPEDTYVTIVGYLDLPGSTHCSTGATARCGISLVDPTDRSRSIPIFVYTPLTGNTPAPNEMFELPALYSDSDLKVRASTGEVVGNGARVRVTGQVCQTTDGMACISQITEIKSE